MTAQASPVRGALGVLLRWLACFCCAALLAPGFNSFESPDANVARAFAQTGRFSLDTEPAFGSYIHGRDGRYYALHEFVPDLLAAPVALAAERARRAWSIPFDRTFGLLMSFVAAAFFATTVVLLAGVGALIGVPRRYTVAALVLLTLGSQYLVYASSPPDVSLAAPILAACWLAWLRAERGMRGGWLLAGFCAGLLPAVKITNGSTLPILLVLAATAPALEGRRLAQVSRVIQTGIGAVPGLLIVAGWNYVRIGSWLHAPYHGEAVTFSVRSLPVGFLGTLISPGKGVFVFTPVLLLMPLVFSRAGIGRTHGRTVAFVFGSLALTMAGIAGTAPWGSAGGWGVRYYVPWLPAVLLLLVAEAWRRRAHPGPWKVVGAAAVAAGLVMNLSGLLTNFHYRQQLCGYDEWSLRSANGCAVRALPGNLARTAGVSIPDVVVPGASPADVFVSNRLALWWYAVRLAGVLPLVSWSIGGGLLLMAALLWTLDRKLPVGP